MARIFLLLLIMIVVVCPGEMDAASHVGDHVLDMTYRLGPNTNYWPWPGMKKFHFSVDYRNYSDTTGWYEGNSYCAATNGGTSLEAPAFLIQGGSTVDKIPIHKLIGPAVKIDMTSRVYGDPDAELSVADIQQWEATNGRIPEKSLVFVYTGWGQYISDRTAFFGHSSETEWLDSQGNSLLHFPGVSTSAATWLASNRNILGVGIDTASLDHGQSVTRSASVALYSKGIYGLTTVANLDQIPTTGSTVLAFPMLIKDVSGAPARIVAVQEKVFSVEADDVADLTYAFSVGTTYWPGSGAGFNITSIHRGPAGSIAWLDQSYFCTPEHGGSHIDFPAHMYKDRLRAHEMHVGKYIAPAVKVNIQDKVAKNPDALLTADDLKEWEKVHGKIPDDAVLFVRTGWGAHYGNRTAYLGSADTEVWKDADGNSLLHFPGISKEAARWLLDHRNISGMAIDTASLDHGPDVTFRSHVTLFDHNIYGVENVGNMETVDNFHETGSTAYILPIHLYEGSGGAARIVVIKDKDGGKTSGTLGLSSSFRLSLVSLATFLALKLG